jgi:hypothetical protein
MKIPSNCNGISVVYKGGAEDGKENFVPKGKIEEFEDSYEFIDNLDPTQENGMVVIFKSDIRKIIFHTHFGDVK